jgi:hypothetical protein
MLHQDHIVRTGNEQSDNTTADASSETVANAAALFGLSILYMTCRIHVIAPDRSIAVVRAMIDTGAGGSFISEKVARSLNLPRRREAVQIHGIGGLRTDHSSTTSVTFKVAPIA